MLVLLLLLQVMLGVDRLDMIKASPRSCFLEQGLP
jgi:hypothetical protein